MEYESPVTVDDALAIMQKTKGNIQLLAGGTDLLVQMQSQTVDPEIILDVKNIKEMTEIKKVDNKFMIGAAVSGMEIIDHKDFSETWPGVVDGVKLIGSIQIKGRASMGGNLCNASPAADSIPAMISSDANAYIVGPNGSREVPVEDFITGPGKNSLQTNEILLAIKFPEKRLNSSGAYLRFTPRTEMDIAVAGVGVNVALGSSGNIESAKIAIGAVAEKALLVEDAARELIGKSPSDEVMEAYINQVRIAARPIDDKRGTVDFRKQVIGVLAHRALKIALERIRNG
tara:strand:- start:25006 stop:25866 length:861 start_codon:yes stop_codon:yes gene_type:complete